MDAALGRELLASEKDRAENLMIVDLLRNDISRIAEVGSVRVPELFAVESYATVHQMVSRVVGRPKPGVGLGEVFAALFPCGSVTGAPKLRAMQIIRELEPWPREAYCGAIGWIARDERREAGAEGPSRAAFNVAIRTLRLTPGGNGPGEKGAGRAVLGVGSAIVADSQSLPEWRECLVKGDFVRQSAAAACDLIETMRFDPNTSPDGTQFALSPIGKKYFTNAVLKVSGLITRRLYQLGREIPGRIDAADPAVQAAVDAYRRSHSG